MLPDGLSDTWGHVRTPEEAAAAAAAAAAQRGGGQGGPALPKPQPLLTVNNERFMVPEALLHPSGRFGRSVGRSICTWKAAVGQRWRAWGWLSGWW